MKLLVGVIEARNLRAMDLNGFSDPYVKLQLGRQKFRTKVVKKNLNPSWGEDFSFRVEDLKEELLISVLDEDTFFNHDFVGQLKLPISEVFDAENKSLGTAWYTLQPKNKKSKHKDCGEILLSISLSQNNSFIDETLTSKCAQHMEKHDDIGSESPSFSFDNPLGSSSEADSVKEEKSMTQNFACRFAQIFLKKGETASTSSRSLAMSDLPETPRTEVSEDKDFENFEDQSSDETFEEAMRTLESKHQGTETPSNFPGILLDQSYMIAPSDMNALLFSPDSNFTKDLAELQGTTELQQGPWRFENGGENLKRVVTYTKAATKLIKAVKATEEHTYLKADGSVFAVLVSVSTPDVIYGSTFRTELLFCITPGPELSSGEQSSRLVISWRMNFLQSTMMKGMIEGGARQGLKDSFEQLASLLSQTVKPIDLKDLGSEKEQVLASLQVEPQSVWKLATQYFLNFTVVSTVIMGLYVLAHILLAMPSTIQGLEFQGLDLPDSIGEVVVCGILVLQGERVLEMIARFMQARLQKGSDHGVKAQGDGWLLTVALIEGSSLAAVDSTGFSDPYVIFTCNGKTRTSSIKFQKLDPQWNEIFEFDAMEDPPSMLDIEVFDFDGPFYEATSLGHAEINFLKSNLSDLADVWIPLQGKLAQACQSKLHLRIFLNNTRGSNVVKEYLTKMEKEVGKKINVRSPQTNSAFQKLFGLPPEEFLINDFTCHLKRKMILQGRLFLSARIIGFHANLFGHRTKFFFLWEDIEDIQILPPTLASMGSPSIIIILRRGRGADAKHGAKTQDEEGRLKFHFHSFVSYNVAHRTIMALWKSRSLSPEQKVRIAEEESGGKLQTEESGTFMGLEDVSMSEIYSSVLPVPANFFIELFGGGRLDRKVMETVGCVDYSHTQWELVKSDVYQRQVCFKLDKNVSRYKGEVTSSQQRSPLSDRNGWVVEEAMALQGVPLGDYFTLHVRYQVEDNPTKSKACNVHVFFGIAWLNSTKHQKRITKNIVSNLTDRLKAMFSLVEKEFMAGK
ncbi:C2 calcium-dependent membrane targeting [Macleaya cordata]|uniref:C2 calcium-dependent membrane targeting n=1 Tax=Macleaya cordata TaxID=56857 RepID=A0A200RAK6_MACCD|nr:C2 calcium-dependent membrane targeting [Macleaya cordata]